jgi:uncharacterized protein
MTAPIRPPFTLESATAKVQSAEDAWNTRDPERVALAYTGDSEWRNRDEFIRGREQIKAFLQRKCQENSITGLRKNSGASPKIASRCVFEYECHDAQGQWWRSYGNEMWEFNLEGLMRRRFASINDLAIREDERRLLPST